MLPDAEALATEVILLVKTALTPVVERLAAAEARLQTLGDLRDRVGTVEAKSATAEELGTLRERIAVVEVRAQAPGPAGVNGTNGADGLGFEDLAVDFDGDRTLSLTFARGLEKKSFPIVLPFLRYEGVFQEGKAYDVGDVVTWAGSTWHCKAATASKPGDGAPAWTLIVKRGRDGKDGKDAPGTLPVVRVGGS